MSREVTLEIMKSIIENYLENEITRQQVVEQLINRVDVGFIHNLDVKTEPDNFFITDCYWTIKHLTESGYETTDEEIRYFSECFSGKRSYNVDEKNKMLRNHFAGLRDKRDK